MSSVKEDTLKGVRWTAIEKISVQGITFILGIIIARRLSPDDYGVVGMLAIFMAIGDSFVDSGFANALVRKINRTETDYSTVFYFNIVIGIIAYLILCLCAPWIAGFYDTPVLESVLRVYAISLIIHSLSIVQVARLTVAIDFKTQAKANFVSAVVSGIIGVTLAYTGWGVWTLVYQAVARAGLNTILLWIFAKWIPRWEFSWKSFNDLFGYGSKLLLSGLINTLYTNMSTLVIGKFYKPADLGFYSRGVQIAQLPSQNFNSIFQRVTFPILAKLQNDEEHLISAYRKYICMSSLLIFFVMTLLAAVGKPLVQILLGEKWLEAVIYLQLFCFAQMFDHISAINLNLLQVKGRSDLFLKLEIIKKTISFAILFASIPFGVVAICASKILYSQIAVFINTYYTGKIFHLGYIAQLKDFSVFFIYSVLACVPSFILSILNTNNYIKLFLGIIVSTGLYLIFLRSNDHMIYIKNILLSYLHSNEKNNNKKNSQ